MKKLLLFLIIPFLSFGQIVTEDCNSIPDPGYCLAAFEIYYFDQYTTQCEVSLWGGCDGLVPFWTLEECQNGCENTESEGCIDETACNYDELAIEDDGSCTYPDLPYGWGGEYGYDCEGNCLLPEDMCSCEEINYDEIWLIEGCWWPMDPPDNWIYPIDVIFEFDPINCAIVTWPYCGCLDYDNTGWCDESSLIGCMDWPACNYNSDAVQDDESCAFPGDSCELDNGNPGLYNDSCECVGIISIDEFENSKTLIKVVDILGRETTNKGFQLEIYDDGSVEKKYLVK